jgi:hypothetical protein
LARHRDIRGATSQEFRAIPTDEDQHVYVGRYNSEGEPIVEAWEEIPLEKLEETIDRFLRLQSAPDGRIDDEGVGQPTYSYPINGMSVYDPRMSDCGRFEVDPMQAYGLTPEDVAALDEANRSLSEIIARRKIQ